MRLTDIIQLDCIKAPLLASDKQQAIFELVDHLADAVGIENHDELKHVVWQRETTRTTGIGQGIAIPHGKSDNVDRLIMAIGKPENPIEFGAIDKKPVDIIFLLVSPVDETGPHIRALASISHMLVNDDFRAALKAAKNPQTIYKLIEDQTNNAD